MFAWVMVSVAAFVYIVVALAFTISYALYKVSHSWHPPYPDPAYDVHLFKEETAKVQEALVSIVARKVVDATLGVHCATCLKTHDYELGPDEGVCLLCGGSLQDAGDPIGATDARSRAVQQVANEFARILAKLQAADTRTPIEKKYDGDWGKN